MANSQSAVTAGIWIHYQNRRRWLINPGQEYIRLETAYGSLSEDPDIEAFLKRGIESGQIVDTGRPEFKQWRVAVGSFPLLWEFLESLDKPLDVDIADDGARSHPRYFPAEVRVMAHVQA